MTIANVTLNDTFDTWRTRTNQLIVQSEESHALALASFNYANSATFTAANIATEILISNTTVQGLITNSSNVIVTAYLANTNLADVHNKANDAYTRANSSLARSNLALTIANNASNTALSVEANVGIIVANTLMSNAAIINIIGATANTIAANVLANVDLITVSNTAPITPVNGQVWWNTDIARLLLYYVDEDSSQWVDTNPVTNIEAAYDTANAAFNAANGAPTTSRVNTIYTVANGAYDLANTVNSALANVGGGGTTITIGDETTNAATFYVTLSPNTSGNVSQLNVSSTKLTYNPSTGTLSSTVFNSLSDISAKENISTISDALEIVQRMNGVSFTWKDNGRPSFGLIAQELEQVAPELVDSSGDMKTVNYDGIIAFLVEAIKQLNEKLEDRK